MRCEVSFIVPQNNSIIHDVQAMLVKRKQGYHRVYTQGLWVDARGEAYPERGYKYTALCDCGATAVDILVDVANILHGEGESAMYLSISFGAVPHTRSFVIPTRVTGEDSVAPSMRESYNQFVMLLEKMEFDFPNSTMTPIPTPTSGPKQANPSTEEDRTLIAPPPSTPAPSNEKATKPSKLPALTLSEFGTLLALLLGQNAPRR